MYAVIKTGGKQYRVQAGDLLVVEKLDGQPGDSVSFGDVLMLGGGEGDVTVGAPLIDGAAVTATLIETRKGEKIKVFKKIRRQGYRRTQGHRQFESVLRVTAVAGGGQESKWDGTVDLTPKSVLDARARNLPNAIAAAEAARPSVAAPAEEKAAPKPRARKKAESADAAPAAEA
jgi:large subunit ribosomal protein L21